MTRRRSPSLYDRNRAFIITRSRLGGKKRIAAGDNFGGLGEAARRSRFLARIPLLAAGGCVNLERVVPFYSVSILKALFMRSLPIYLLTLTAVVSFAYSSSAAEVTKDSLPQLKKDLSEGKGILIDVREKREWDQGHVEGALFLPLSKLQEAGGEKMLKEALPKDKVIYTYCAAGFRAASCAKLMAEHGYEVHPLKPGYRELIDAGFPKAME